MSICHLASTLWRLLMWSLKVSMEIGPFRRWTAMNFSFPTASILVSIKRTQLDMKNSTSVASGCSVKMVSQSHTLNLFSAISFTINRTSARCSGTISGVCIVLTWGTRQSRFKTFRPTTATKHRPSSTITATRPRTTSSLSSTPVRISPLWLARQTAKQRLKVKLSLINSLSKLRFRRRSGTRRTSLGTTKEWTLSFKQTRSS